MRSDPDLKDPIYKDLSDTLFVEPWVQILMRSHDPTYRKERLMPLVQRLSGVEQRGEEFKLALVTTHALGGDKAINVMLESEGLWTLET